jgi:hypothetical protein
VGSRCLAPSPSAPTSACPKAAWNQCPKTDPTKGDLAASYLLATLYTNANDAGSSLALQASISTGHPIGSSMPTATSRAPWAARSGGVFHAR